jgi:NitT/TauT family transport system substrate-binding protein
MKMFKKKGGVIVLVLASLLITLFAGVQSVSALETIRIVPWGPKLIDFIDLYVGEENGYFAKAGIRIEQLRGAGAGDAVRNVVVGNADIAMADPLSGLFAIQAGADLEAFYAPYTQNWMTLLVNKARGIKTPSDLKGKTIAVTSMASTSRYYLMLLLGANGLSENDVTEVATGHDFASVMLSERADAASSWGSANWGMLVAGGIPKDKVAHYEIWPYSDYIAGPNDVYFAKRDWLQKNKDLVQRFINALEKSKRFVQAYPDEAAKIGKRYAVGADNLVRNRAVIDYRIQMQNSGPGVIENGMGWIDLDEMAKLARESLKLGILKKEMDVSKIFTNKFIK